MRHLLSARDLSREELLAVINRGLHFARFGAPRRAPFVVGLAFFDPSTRTRVGFDVATARLGGHATILTETKVSPVMSAGESLHDTLRSVGPYFDVLCIRHTDGASAAVAAEAVEECCVINCGNGPDEHPTQAVIDVAAIAERFGRPPDGMHIVMVGDLASMRAAHSLLVALASFRAVTVTAVTSPSRAMPEEYVRPFLAAGHSFARAESLMPIAASADVVYVAGMPPGVGSERMDDATRARFAVSEAVVSGLRSDALILSPLPRIDEIDESVDAMPQAGYFRQSALGVWVRAAVLEFLMDS